MTGCPAMDLAHSVNPKIDEKFKKKYIGVGHKVDYDKISDIFSSLNEDKQFKKRK